MGGIPFQETGLLPGFEADIRTLDIDFLVKNLRKPPSPKNVPALAREAGYLVESERLSGITKIYDQSGLEMEFLLGKRGAGLETALKTNLGVVAQTLRHTDLLVHNAKEVNYLGMKVFVPTPEAYVIHKMIINGERGSKQGKDRLAVLHLFPYLDAEQYRILVSSLSKKERDIVQVFENTYI